MIINFLLWFRLLTYPHNKVLHSNAYYDFWCSLSNNRYREIIQLFHGDRYSLDIPELDEEWFENAQFIDHSKGERPKSNRYK